MFNFQTLREHLELGISTVTKTGNGKKHFEEIFVQDRRYPLISLVLVSRGNSIVHYSQEPNSAFQRVLSCLFSSKVNSCGHWGICLLGGYVTFISYFLSLKFWLHEHCFKGQSLIGKAYGVFVHIISSETQVALSIFLQLIPCASNRMTTCCSLAEIF